MFSGTSILTSATARAQSPAARPDGAPTANSGQAAPTVPHTAWQAGVFVDIGYLNSFGSPSNHPFRSRGTTTRVDELNVQIGGGYVRKTATPASPWGLELTAHVGEDAKLFGFSATAPNMPGATRLRHLGPANVSYLTAVGEGLSLQAGIFSSFIGYDSLYAKDNLTYTRPWTADFTPYLMLGVNGSYPVSGKLTVTGFVVNGYWHLANANRVPSFGGQIAHKASEFVTVKQTVLYGPHQANTTLRYWRFLSNTILERKTARLTAALDFHVSSEIVDAPATPRAWWAAGQLPVVIRQPWRVTVRPEFAWDSQGRWTGFEQSVRALTTTLEYRARVRQFQPMVRLEHRYDRSAGGEGGFFTDIAPGVVGLTPRQHLLALALIVTADAPSHR